MSDRDSKSDIRGGRLAPEAYAKNFADAHPPLAPNQALVESDRCYFCHDAPCIQACPTQIDIPSFIRKIATGNTKGAAHDILKQNIMGAVCARVCPTEVLCEGACVRNDQEHKPVAIGALQRHATDWLFGRGIQLFKRAASTGKRVAVVGGGPAGLSCAHRLSMLGNSVTVFETREKLGGLNEYGVAAYKVIGQIAQREVEYLLEIGGIECKLGQRLGRDIPLSRLRQDYDAVFLGVGLGGVNALGVDEPPAGVFDAIAYIEKLRQARDLSQMPVGHGVVVIGGGMTAIDIASQVKRLGAEDVTIVYRRSPENMGASRKEQAWAQTSGVRIKHWARPLRLLARDGALTAVEFEQTRLDSHGRLAGTGAKFTMAADMVFKAIGQVLIKDGLDGKADVLEMSAGRIAVDAERKTSIPGVWAGGDCVAGGQDLTVVAVEDGKRAALSIDRHLRAVSKTEAQHG
ncbi:MAG TPA: NAD(P)-dependent oxidoreductase [Burkholderiales bacterium]|nr:NAD(P)-dependent oxidoreductase [Burkholderiales bacterium]